MQRQAISAKTPSFSRYSKGFNFCVHNQCHLNFTIAFCLSISTVNCSAQCSRSVSNLIHSAAKCTESLLTLEHASGYVAHHSITCAKLTHHLGARIKLAHCLVHVYAKSIKWLMRTYHTIHVCTCVCVHTHTCTYMYKI